MINKIFRYLRDFLHLTIWDLSQNYRFTKSQQRFLITHHPSSQPLFYDVFLHWMEAHLPKVRSHFELRPIPSCINNWKKYVLHVPWLQDPVQQWSLITYHFSNNIALKCDQHNIPIINRVDQLINCSRSLSSQLLVAAKTNFYIPRTVLITNLNEFRKNAYNLNFPILIRENWGHQGSILRADNLAQIQKLPLERLLRPVAIEIINVQSPDGFFRKYRYLIAGDTGVSLSMHMTKNWICRGETSTYNKQMLTEEMEYIQLKNPHHDDFKNLQKSLKLDFIAFDYSFDNNGKIILWEANPFPLLHFPGGKIRHIYGSLATTRVFAAMIKLYFQKAKLNLPNEIDSLLVLTK